MSGHIFLCTICRHARLAKWWYTFRLYVTFYWGKNMYTIQNIYICINIFLTHFVCRVIYSKPKNRNGHSLWNTTVPLLFFLVRTVFFVSITSDLYPSCVSQPSFALDHLWCPHKQNFVTFQHSDSGEETLLLSFHAQQSWCYPTHNINQQIWSNSTYCVFLF